MEFKSIAALKKLGALKKKKPSDDDGKGDFFGKLMSKKANEKSDAAETPAQHKEAAEAHRFAATKATGGMKEMHLNRAKGHEEKGCK